MKGKKEESKWDQTAPGAEGAEAQGRDPRLHGRPLERKSSEAVGE